MFFYFFCSIVKVNYFLFCLIILLYLVSSFLHTSSLLVPYTYISIESIDCILLSSLALYVILLTSSVNTLSFLLLNLRRDFNIDLLFFYEFFMIFFKTFNINFFSNCYILFSNRVKI